MTEITSGAAVTEITSAAAGGDAETAPPAAGVSRAPKGSVLDALRSGVNDVRDATEKVLPIGKHARLKARYRPLTEDEQTDLEARSERMQAELKRTLRNTKDGDEQKVSRQRDLQAQLDAHLLAVSCVELLYHDPEDGLVPLAAALGVDGPLRYGRDTAEHLELGETWAGTPVALSDPPKPVEVARALHAWGEDASLAPLRATAQLLRLWMSGLSGEALEETLEGI